MLSFQNEIIINKKSLPPATTNTRTRTKRRGRKEEEKILFIIIFFLYVAHAYQACKFKKSIHFLRGCVRDEPDRHSLEREIVGTSIKYFLKKKNYVLLLLLSVILKNFFFFQAIICIISMSRKYPNCCNSLAIR